jgi:hypothetical protein
VRCCDGRIAAIDAVVVKCHDDVTITALLLGICALDAGARVMTHVALSGSEHRIGILRGIRNVLQHVPVFHYLTLLDTEDIDHRLGSGAVIAAPSNLSH